MMIDPAPIALFDDFARLLSYPREGYPAAARDLAARLAAAHPDGRRHLESFAEAIREMTTVQLEELYTRTFDLNPIACLEIGWHLFGEQYARGAFLVRMRESLRRLGINESTELPDHLTHVLPLMARMESGEAAQMTTAYLLPAMDKILENLRDQDVGEPPHNPYQQLLQAIRCVIEKSLTPGGGMRCAP